MSTLSCFVTFYLYFYSYLLKIALEVQYINGKLELDVWLAKAKEDLDAPSFVHKYIESTSLRLDPKTVTLDGHVTFVHQNVFVNNSLYFYHKLDMGPL